MSEHYSNMVFIKKQVLMNTLKELTSVDKEIITCIHKAEANRSIDIEYYLLKHCVFMEQDTPSYLVCIDISILKSSISKFYQKDFDSSFDFNNHAKWDEV